MSTIPMAPLLFEVTEQPMAGQLTTLETALAYMLAGNATITVRSKVTSNRYTYKIRKAKEETGKDPVWFVSLLRGPDNENDFCYMGLLTDKVPASPSYPRITFRFTAKSTVRPTAQSAQAFTWLWDKMIGMKAPAHLSPIVEIWHTGQCGRCGRKLTVPSSVEAGIGPECASKMGGSK